MIRKAKKSPKTVCPSARGRLRDSVCRPSQVQRPEEQESIWRTENQLASAGDLKGADPGLSLLSDPPAVDPDGLDT